MVIIVCVLIYPGAGDTRQEERLPRPTPVHQTAPDPHINRTQVIHAYTLAYHALYGDFSGLAGLFLRLAGRAVRAPETPGGAEGAFG